ncbi:MAG: hypothetical protein NC200_05570 [Candidatus Gastranaerophilales bacterium]|nr:hypothetical protein [Candidatus Gastranaerophilales bacterium]
MCQALTDLQTGTYWNLIYVEEYQRSDGTVVSGYYINKYHKKYKYN